MEDDTVSDAIKANAAGPKAATGDEGSVVQHPLPDQIEADRYLASKEAAKSPSRGLRFTQINPGNRW